MSFTPCDCTTLQVVSSVDKKKGATRQHFKDADGVWCATVVPGTPKDSVHQHTLLVPSAAASARMEKQQRVCDAETALERGKVEKREYLRSKRKNKEKLTEADLELLCDIVLGEE